MRDGSQLETAAEPPPDDSGAASGTPARAARTARKAGAAWPSRRMLLPLGLFLLALGARLVFVCLYHSPRDYVFSDMSIYDLRARNLLSGALSAWDSFTPVGYPAFLALTYRLGGDAFTVGVLQALLGALTTLSTFALARRVFRSQLAAAAVGLVSALHPPAIFYTGFLLTETSFSCLLVGAAWALAASIQRRSRWGFFACGLLLGLGATVRPNLLLFLPCVPWLIGLRSGRRWREAALACGLTLAAFALPVAAAAAHNTRLVGKPTLGTNGGLNFYLNFAAVRGVRYRDARGTYGITPIPNLAYHSQDEWVKVPFYADMHYYARGWQLLREDPSRLKVALRNLEESCGAGRQGYWPGDVREAWQSLHRRLFLVAGITPALVAIVLLACRRRYAVARHRPLLIAAALVSSSVVTLLLFLGDPRMRVPFDPLLIVLAAAAYGWAGGAALARLKEARGRAVQNLPRR